MTVEADLYDTLKVLVASNKAFPDMAPAKTPPPYLTFQQTGGEAPIFMERAVPSKQNGRFSVTAWAETRDDAAALIKLVEPALVVATVFDAKPLGAPIALYDEDTMLRGAQQDFSIWSNR